MQYTITNKTKGETITLPTKHTIKPGKSIEVDDQVVKKCDRFLASHRRRLEVIEVSAGSGKVSKAGKK